jgi:spore maturation protein CgeB
MQDLPKKLNYYIKDKLKREQIARAGFNLVNQKHTFTNRFRQMLEIINKQK